LKLLGGEALLRWFHPDRGQIPTGDFIAVAEETGLIGDIGPLGTTAGVPGSEPMAQRGIGFCRTSP